MKKINLKKLGLASLVLAIGSQAMAVTDNSTDLWVGMGAQSNETYTTTSPKNPTKTTAIGVNLGTGIINDSFGINTYDFLVGYSGSYVGNSTGTYNMTNTTSSFSHGAWIGQTWTDNGVTTGNGTLNMKNGSTLTTNNLSVGEIGTGVATFTDSTIAITDFLKVGSSSGTGTVTLNNSDLSSQIYYYLI